MTDKPFYQRSLDSFADHIICRVRQGENGLFYAVLDLGPEPYVSEPDFSTCAETASEAVKQCAIKIRNDAVGIGKYAPHSVLQGYDLHWRLAKHWDEKETQCLQSHDPAEQTVHKGGRDERSDSDRCQRGSEIHHAGGRLGSAWAARC